MATKTTTENGRFTLEVPLDASSIEDFKPEKPVKVLVHGPKGSLSSSIVRLSDKGQGLAKFTFKQHPGGIRVIVGPNDATDEELTGLQTISVDIPARQWAGQTALKLTPIVIGPYYWHWWFIWWRTFTVCGRVICPDGSPVVGATVCAYDVDWWWWYSSTQQIACATTDINGAFCIKFKWHCGWWPWWWWKTRFWQVDPVLIERITPVLQRNPDLHTLIQPKPQPSFNDFREFLGADAAHLGSASAINPTTLAQLRDPLLRRLPPELELERLKIWPWYPWYPWNDCAPDVIFKVTQNCTGAGDTNVIVNETVFDARPNISTTLNDVTLVANDQACCLPPSLPCGQPDCVALTLACGLTVDTIGGNIGAPAVPSALFGLQAPGAATTYSDRPFGGAVPISGTADCMEPVDYYEFKWATSSSGPWNDMPPNANGAFTRRYIRFSPFSLNNPVPFAPQLISGRNVYETLKHFEQNNPPNDWNANRWWYVNRDLLINWLTENFTPGDGTYYLQVTGYDSPSAGVLDLSSARVLDICGTQNPNYIVLTVDNRFVGPGPNDWHGDNCQTVHSCTEQPDTKIISIKILNASQYGGVTTGVQPCGIYDVKWPDQVQIDFIAYDPDGYLAQYGLQTHYGVNLSRNLLALSPTLTPGPVFSGPGPVSPALQEGPTYAHALTQGGPAIRPVWKGGVMRLVMPATDDPSEPGLPKGAFPVSCCYQLRLDAWKRTIVNCNGQFTNTSETSFTINVVQ